MITSFTTLSEVLSIIGTKNYKILGKKNHKIVGFKPITSATKGELTFCSSSNSKGMHLISKSNASIIICPIKFRNKIQRSKSTLIFVENPRLAFIRCLQNSIEREIPRGIHKTAIVESRKIGKNVYIGPYTHIGKNVSIGNNVLIYGGVHIYGNTKIGNNVIIDSSTVIGSDGFGFEKNDSNKWEKFPHIGWIEIHDDVEIGANVCIDRGTLEGTVIGRGTKIDNLVHIAHNVKIGNDCMVIAQSLLAGSCILENNVYVAMCAMIRDGIRIGKNATVGMGAVVTKDVPANITVIGVPARPIKKQH